MYELDKFGIKVVKPTNVFASKVNRFADKNLQEKQRLPGPGTYTGAAEVTNTWGKKEKKRPSPHKNPDWAQVPWNKMHPPSIPSHDFVFGYEEENGELIR